MLSSRIFIREGTPRAKNGHDVDIVEAFKEAPIQMLTLKIIGGFWGNNRKIQ